MTQWEVVARISLALGFVSAGIIAIDIALGRHQMMAVMNLVWPITALYSGPLGLAAYFFVGRAMPMMAQPNTTHILVLRFIASPFSRGANRVCQVYQS